MYFHREDVISELVKNIIGPSLEGVEILLLQQIKMILYGINDLFSDSTMVDTTPPVYSSWTL